MSRQKSWNLGKPVQTKIPETASIIFTGSCCNVFHQHAVSKNSPKNNSGSFVNSTVTLYGDSTHSPSEGVPSMPALGDVRDVWPICGLRAGLRLKCAGSRAHGSWDSNSSSHAHSCPSLFSIINSMSMTQNTAPAVLNEVAGLWFIGCAAVLY